MSFIPTPHHWDGRTAAGLPSELQTSPCSHSLQTWTAPARDRNRRPFRRNRSAGRPGGGVAGGVS